MEGRQEGKATRWQDLPVAAKVVISRTRRRALVPQPPSQSRSPLRLCRVFQYVANLSLLFLFDFSVMPAQSFSLLLIKSKIIIIIWKIVSVFLGIKYLNSQTNGPCLFLLKVRALKCHSKLNVPWKIISFLVTLLFIPFYLHINYPQ